jgi:hypothetical protein
LTVRIFAADYRARSGVGDLGAGKAVDHMQQTGAKRRRTIILVVALLLLAALGGVIYLVFVRGREPSPPPAEPAPKKVEVPPDAAPARPDTARPVDAAAKVDTQAQGGQGGGRSTRRIAVVRKPDARPPDARPPDARRPDARKPDAPKPDYGKLPPWPKGFKFVPAQVEIRHRNRMTKTFVLVELIYLVDKRKVFGRADKAGALDKKRDMKIFSGVLNSGQHSLVVRAVYRGGAHGLFTYHQSYRYSIVSQYTFTANPTRRTVITVEGREKGGPNTPLKDKPSLKFSHRMVPLSK